MSHRRALWAVLAAPSVLFAVPRDVAFTESAVSVEAYDFVEITAMVTAPDDANPLTGATLAGSFLHRFRMVEDRAAR